MDVELVQVDHRWACALPETELPKEKVQDALLSFRHDAGRDAVRQVRRALAPIAGPGRAFLPGRLRFQGPTYDLKVLVRADRVDVRSRHRLGAANLKRLVSALAEVPGARELELHGRVPQYSKAFSNLRACTPCQAKRL